jgi:lysophospholipase L1-like esterase
MVRSKRPDVARIGRRFLAAIGVAAILARPDAAPAQVAGEHWVGTWATAEVLRPAATAEGQPPAAGGGRGGPPPISSFANQTIRQVVHTSIGGDRVRVVLSNVFGSAPLAIGGAHAALRDNGAAIVPGTDRALTFSGRPIMTIPTGSIGVSDPIALPVPPLSDLVVDLYLPGETAAPLTAHNGAFQTNYVTGGNHLGETSLATPTPTQSWFLVSRVEVVASESVGAIVAFGDSITDGTRSTPDTNNRWPDHLARRLLGGAGPRGGSVGVMNAGIAGNRVLGDGVPTPAYNAGVSALARFDRNALTAPGVTHIVVLEGINDIRGFAGPGTPRQEPTPTAVDITRGYRQLIERAHAHGLKIYGATLTPFAGSNGWSAGDEEKRQAVNEWIRTTGMYDAVIDFDRAVRDPADPTKLRAEYDSGDHLHPSDAGYRAMADAIDLKLFGAAQATRAAAVR